MKKRIPVPKKEWIVVSNTHEPLITKEEFQMAQQLFKTRSSPREPKDRHLAFRPGVLRGLRLSNDLRKRRSQDLPSLFLQPAVSRLLQNPLRPEDEVERTLLDSLRKLSEGIQPQSLYPEFPRKSRELAARELRSAKEQLEFYRRAGRDSKFSEYSAAVFELLRAMAAQGGRFGGGADC